MSEGRGTSENGISLFNGDLLIEKLNFKRICRPSSICTCSGMDLNTKGKGTLWSLY